MAAKHHQMVRKSGQTILKISLHKASLTSQHDVINPKRIKQNRNISSNSSNPYW